MSDPTHHEQHDAAQTPEAERRKQPGDGNATAGLDHVQPRAAAPMSFAERVVAQFRAQDPAAWFNASPLERFQAKEAAYQGQRQLVMQMHRNSLGPLQYAAQNSAPFWEADALQYAGQAPAVGDDASALQYAADHPAPGQQTGPKTTSDVKRVAATGLEGAAPGMPHQQQIQASFGKHDISNVRSSVGGQAEKANAQLGSLAYASGDKISFRGQPDLFTAAHEAAHIVQQRAGVNLKSGIGEVGDTYEQHADAVASLVVQGKSAEALLDQKAPSTPSKSTPTTDSSPVQHKKPTPERQKDPFRDEAELCGIERIGHKLPTGVRELPRRRHVSFKSDTGGKVSEFVPQRKFDAEDEKACPPIDFDAKLQRENQVWFRSNFGDVPPGYRALAEKKALYVNAHMRWSQLGKPGMTPKVVNDALQGDKKTKDKVLADPGLGRSMGQGRNILLFKVRAALRRMVEARAKAKQKALVLATLLKQIERRERISELKGVEGSRKRELERISARTKLVQDQVRVITNIGELALDPKKLPTLLGNSAAALVDLGAQLLSDNVNAKYGGQIAILKARISELGKRIDSAKIDAAMDDLALFNSKIPDADAAYLAVLNDARTQFGHSGALLSRMLPSKEGAKLGSSVSAIPVMHELRVFSASVASAASVLSGHPKRNELLHGMFNSPLEISCTPGHERETVLTTMDKLADSRLRPEVPKDTTIGGNNPGPNHEKKHVNSLTRDKQKADVMIERAKFARQKLDLAFNVAEAESKRMPSRVELFKKMAVDADNLSRTVNPALLQGDPLSDQKKQG